MIDVIVPTFNRIDDIKIFIEKIQQQSFKNYNVLIIDDCSKVEVEKLIPTNDPRFKYYRFDENRGQSYARNFAVEQSTSEYLIFLDDDAFFLDKDALFNFLEYVKIDTNDGWMFDVIEPNKPPLSSRVKSKSGDEIGEFIACACAFRRKSFLELTGFVSYFHSYGEETEMVMRMILKNQNMIFLPEIKVFHNYMPETRDKSWLKRFMKNSMRNDVLIIFLHYPFMLIPFYLTAKFLSRFFSEMRNSEFKLIAFTQVIKGFFIGILFSFKILHFRRALTMQQFNYWKKIRW